MKLTFWSIRAGVSSRRAPRPSETNILEHPCRCGRGSKGVMHFFTLGFFKCFSPWAFLSIAIWGGGVIHHQCSFLEPGKRRFTTGAPSAHTV